MAKVIYERRIPEVNLRRCRRKRVSRNNQLRRPHVRRSHLSCGRNPRSRLKLPGNSLPHFRRQCEIAGDGMLGAVTARRAGLIALQGNDRLADVCSGILYTAAVPVALAQFRSVLYSNRRRFVLRFIRTRTPSTTEYVTYASKYLYSALPAPLTSRPRLRV